MFGLLRPVGTEQSFFREGRVTAESPVLEVAAQFGWDYVLEERETGEC
jgi:hypothetical protein